MTRDDELKLQAYLDGELGATESLEFERRLADDAELHKGLAELRAIGERIRSQARYYEAPVRLRQRVLRQIRGAEAGPRRPILLWGGWVAAAACVALAAWLAPTLILEVQGWQPRVEEVLDDHLRSQLGTQRVDIASSDRHTVKPWLSAHLGFSPTVPDLTEQGFELIGGRLDVLDAKPVAVLVYQRRQHLISVFVWPGESTVGASTATQRRGYHLIRWSASGFSYWAVSDLNESELRDFSHLLSAIS